MPLTRDLNKDSQKFDPDGRPVVDLTLKGCVPFIDAMTAGYTINLPTDVLVRVTGDATRHFMWRTEGSVVAGHPRDQVPGVPPAVEGGDGTPLKWTLGWEMVTPPGYSVLFTHPLNRWDLPFRSFSGIVEVDTYHQAVQFPFEFLLELQPGQEHLIPRGTPIIQFIPFRREDWDSEVMAFDARWTRKHRFDFNTQWYRSYRERYWKKKRFQ